MSRLSVLILLLLSGQAFAQSSGQATPYRYNGNFYGYGAFGACQHGYGLFGGGGGAEGLVWKGLAVGVDAGVHSFTDGWSFGHVNPTVGWHFVNRNVRARNEYFVNFGPGVVFGLDGGAGPWGTLGGGAIHWVNKHVGIRWEARMQGFSEEGMFVGRIGVSVRP
jgi:hypothetical protein